MPSEPSIYVVEDDPEIRVLLADFLTREGFRVETADCGAALDRLVERSGRPDLLVLDWMLPREDGLSICRRIHDSGGAAIIMLTAKGEEVDRVLGLEMGADDYVAKPFSPRELLARIRAVLRRAARSPEVPTSQRFCVANLIIDMDSREVTAGAAGAQVALTSAEFELLKCFVTRPQRVLTRDQLLDWTRGRVADVFDRTIDVQVSRLRRKLEGHGGSSGDLIKTVRNAGYILAAPVRRL